MSSHVPSRRPPRARRAQRSRPRVLRLPGLVAAVSMVALLLSPIIATPATAAPPANASTGRGSWQIEDLGNGTYDARWTSPEAFPIGSDRPTIVAENGLAVGAPTVAADGRTVQAVITASQPPKASELDVMLSGQRLDQSETAAIAPRARVAAADPTRAVRRLATDPATPGPYKAVTSDYTRPSVKVAGMPLPIEMVGHVVEPAADAATGPRPLVLFLHGRHSYCFGGSDEQNFTWPCRGKAKEIPSQLGYDYIQRLLASQGYTTVSIRVNGINAQDDAAGDGGASARATLVAKHLDYWAGIAARHQVDLGKVVLVGHSRGGEGVDRASIRIPLSAPYRIVGQVLIAPTDFAAQTAPYVPTVTLLPYCDGDVSDLQGQKYTDTARDLLSDDTSLKSSVLVMGANHNFFNTEWTPGISAAPSGDDWSGEEKEACGTKNPARLTAAQQRAVGKAYVDAAVRQFTAAAGAAQPFLPLFDGSAATVASIGKAVVHSHAVGGGRDLRRPLVDSSLTLSSGASSSFCTGSSSYDYRAGLCGSERVFILPHWPDTAENVPARAFWQLGWTAAGQSAGLALKRPLDLSARTLDLRTIVDPNHPNPSFRVRLSDAAGVTGTFTPVGGGTVPALPTGNSITKLWAQDVRVDARSAAGRLDLTKITKVEITGNSRAGRLWIADLAASPDRTPAVPVKRAPALSIGTLRVKEGDKEGTTVAEVPFTLSSPMTAPGRFQVVTAGQQVGSVQKFTVDLAAGQQRGTIPVGYASNTLDDPATLTTQVSAWALQNLTTDRAGGALVVSDDDPTPKITISRVRPSVTEGERAQWKVTLARPVDYDLSVSAQVVAGPGRDLTGADVPTAWLRQHTFQSGTKGTLAALGVEADGAIPKGSQSVTLSIPTRKDGRKEGEEAVTLTITAGGLIRTQTVRVTDR